MRRFAVLVKNPDGSKYIYKGAGSQDQVKNDIKSLHGKDIEIYPVRGGMRLNFEVDVAIILTVSLIRWIRKNLI